MALELPKPNYEYVTSSSRLGSIFEEISRYPVIEVDTETTGLDPYTSKVSLAQIGLPNKQYVFDVRSGSGLSDIDLSMFKPILTGGKQLRIFQNAVFDIKMIKVNGGFFVENVFDTMLAEDLLTLGINTENSDLQSLVLKYLGMSMSKEPRGTFESYNQVFNQSQLEYAARDVMCLDLIRNLQYEKISKEGLSRALDLELEFIKPMYEMELNGVCMDIERWRALIKDADTQRMKWYNEASSLLSSSSDQLMLFDLPSLNIDSNKQLMEALHSMGINVKDVQEGTLKKHKSNPAIAALLEYRSFQKLISTYGESMLSLINPITGRLHTSFRQMVSTGRMSSSKPNLQNIPKEQFYRSGFIAKPGYRLITADMSSAELRILCNLSKEPVFLECFAKGIDLHTRSASEVFGLSMEKVTPDLRDKCKAITFGLCVSEDTPIITNRGIIEIKNSRIGDFSANDVGCEEIIDHKFMGEKEVFEIETKYGYTLEVTGDHLVKVINCEGDYVDKCVSDIDVSADYMCLRSGASIFPNNPFGFENFSVPHVTNYKHFELPKFLDERWASFLGLFVSEGSLAKAKSYRERYSSCNFGFSKTASQEFITKIDALFSNLFVDRYSRNVTDTHVIFCINSVLFGEWLYSLFNINDFSIKCPNIRVPDCVKQSPQNVQAAFLSWLFEGDGTIKKNGSGFHIQYSSKSIQLVKDVQLMLLNMGILSSILGEHRKDYPDLYYTLSIIGASNRNLFMKLIGFVTYYKNNKFNSHVGFQNSCYFIPYQGDKVAELKANIGKFERSYIYDVFYNTINFTNKVGSAHLYIYKNYDKFYDFIYRNGIVSLPIKNIRRVGKKRVYDISMNKHEYFLANGFIVHNCYGMSKFGLARRLNIKEDVAEDLINKYFTTFKYIKNYVEEAERMGISKGYSTTICGRKRYYTKPDWESPDYRKIISGIGRQAKNASIQGANADTIKKAMVFLVDRLEKGGYDAKLILTVHDEIIVECKEEQVSEVVPLVEKCIVDGFGFYFNRGGDVPMETDALIGPCWLKSKCDKKKGGCGSKEMNFAPDEKYRTKLVCAKCGKEW